MVSFETVVRLGWAFARVLGGKLARRRNQLTRFVSQYQRDGIVLFEPGDRETLRGAARCIGCGRCDTAALAAGENEYRALGPRGPVAFVLGVSRHSGEHDAAEVGDAATPALLARLTEACPVHVPFAPLVDLVRRRADSLGRVRS